MKLIQVSGFTWICRTLIYYSITIFIFIIAIKKIFILVTERKKLCVIKFNYNFQIPDWLWVKIFFVIGLTIYHLLSGRIFSQLQKDIVNYSSMQMRLWNEVATIFLVAIVFIVILKDTTDYLYGQQILLLPADLGPERRPYSTHYLVLCLNLTAWSSLKIPWN